MDHEYDVLGGYIPSFVQHLKDTCARLGLRTGSEMAEDQSDTVEEPAEAHSWTSTERDAFFRALSVHSRWRPDLIAACVPTKTEWEVWMYLGALEEGAAALATRPDGKKVRPEHGFGDDRRDVDVQVDMSSSSCSHSGSDTDEDEDLCKPALEVSQAWIDVEERMASWIVHEEHLASIEGDADTQDLDDGPPKRGRGRPRSAGRRRARSQVRRQAVSNEDHSQSPVRRSASPEPAPASARKREALMGHLEAPHLLVLDGILREDEDATREESKGREGSVTLTTPVEHEDEEVPGSSHRMDASRETSDISGFPSNAMIDPVLLALSGCANPAGCQSSEKSTSTNGAPPHVPTLDPSSLSNVSSQPASQRTSLQPGMNNMLALPSGNTAPGPANIESDLSSFSPRSRRRIQKRLYMRRKRALLGKDSAAHEGTVYTGTERLKPGKKATPKRSEIVSASVQGSKVPSDVEMKSSEKKSENVRKRNKPGLTLPYKLKAQFTELGVDAAYLRSQGMDLLHLSALGRLMGLCSSLERDEEESAIAQSIDAQLIQHLQAAMVSFVTDVIHRAIVWREREIRLKQRSQAWRHGDQLTIGAVEHAVRSVGARYHTHKEYFKALEAFYGSAAPANASEERSPADETADRSAELPGSSPHRDVYASPSAWGMDPLACLTRTYAPGTTSAMEVDALMSEVSDDGALAEGEDEEDEEDARDMRLAATDEDALWDALGCDVITSGQSRVRAW